MRALMRLSLLGRDGGCSAMFLMLDGELVHLATGKDSGKDSHLNDGHQGQRIQRWYDS